MSNPTKAETLCYQALCNIVHLQHQITQVINNEDFENAWPQIENAKDRLDSTTILMEAYEDAKKLNAKPITFCHICNRFLHQIKGGCTSQTCPNPLNT